MLGVLGVAVFAYLFFTYLFFPILDQNALIKSKYAEVDSEYKALLKTQLTNNQLREVLAKATSKYTALETLLPPQIHQEEAIIFLTDLAKKNEMFVDSYNFSFADKAGAVNAKDSNATQKAPVDDVLNEFQKIINGDQSADLNQYKDKIYTDSAKKGSVLEQYETDLSYFNVTITLKGDYTKFKNYITALESYKSKIIIKQINLTKSDASHTEVIGSLSISYPIYFDQEQLKPYNWQFEKPLLNNNPFEYEVYKLKSIAMPQDYTDPSLPTITEDSEETPADIATKYQASDFYLVLKPANSDANTLTIGKSPHRYTALYADNDGVENAVLKIKKSNGKYQYQYATSLQTFPAENEWNTFDPMTKGVLVLDVQSMGRLPENDQAGTLLSISNDSDLPLSVNIYNEDSTRPRLTVNKVTGKITIKQL